MKTFKRSIWILTLVLVTLSQNLFAQNKILLINNVEIFNGSSENTIQGNILIEGNTISRISTAPIPTNKSANVQLIDGKGKFLMPGLIDAHYHAMFSSLSQIALLTSNIGFVNLVAGKNAENLLMKGFTSIRDLGGPVFGLKQAIDNKVIPGPRIWPREPLFHRQADMEISAFPMRFHPIPPMV